jgi:pilus assembly protein Flp/PilA
MQTNFLKFYARMLDLKTPLVNNQSGQDLIEYALVVSLIALAATAGMGAVASNISNAFVHIGSHLTTYTS